MIIFSGIDKHQDVTESIHTKVISNETEYGSVEDPLSMHRTGSNEASLVSKIPSMINNENVIIAPAQGKKPVSGKKEKGKEKTSISLSSSYG